MSRRKRLQGRLSAFVVTRGLFEVVYVGLGEVFYCRFCTCVRQRERERVKCESDDVRFGHLLWS